jgi:hypothetical protein
MRLGLTIKFFLLSDSCGFVYVGRTLWREDGSVVHCLRFEASHLVASYNSQGYNGGIRLRLHTGTILPMVWSSFITSREPDLVLN